MARASGSREFSSIMARCLDSAFVRRDRRRPHLSKLACVAGKDSKAKFIGMRVFLVDAFVAPIILNTPRAIYDQQQRDV
jgi:hypothetical protein